MPAKISKEIRQRIYELNEEGKPVREILGILKSEGVMISDKSIYNIIKEKTKNRSLTSFDEGTLNASFNESFGDEGKTDDHILPTLTGRQGNKSTREQY